MNGSAESAVQLSRAIVAGADEALLTGVDVAVCPSFVFLSAVGEALQGAGVALGAQTVSEHGSGAFTGEVAPSMLKDLGCAYVIVGHSERRGLYAEGDAQIASKFEAVLKMDLTPILCVGEQLHERESGLTEQVVGRQLDAALETLDAGNLGPIVVAYEPVWAIGTGKTATPDQAEGVHRFIRGRLGERDGDLAERTPVLYGGSVKGENAAGLFAGPNVDGGLIGGAALDAQEFLTICRAAADSA